MRLAAMIAVHKNGFVVGELEGTLENLRTVEMAINSTDNVRANFSSLPTLGTRPPEPDVQRTGKAEDARGDEFEPR